MNNNINEILSFFEIKDSYELFEKAKNNEHFLRLLCTACIQTVDDIEHIKKILK